MTDKLFLRETKLSDLDLYFKWVNEKDTRKASFLSTKSIPYGMHVKWFRDRIPRKSDNTYMFVLEYNKVLIGQIRFDKEVDVYEVSLSLDKRYRGKGMGKILIHKGVEKMVNLGFKNFRAHMRKENIASIMSFERAGFKFIGETIYKNINCYEYCRNE